MDKIKIFPHAKWFTHIIPTPDHGMIYSSESHVVYIGPVEKNEPPVRKTFNIKNIVKILDCDPNWSGPTKHVVVVDVKNNLYILDLELLQVTKGHNVHFNNKIDSDKKNFNLKNIAICFATSNIIYSVDLQLFITYNIAVNECLIDNNNFLPKSFHTSLMKALPNSPNIIAFGSTEGLIVVINIRNKETLHTFCGHYKEITSLSFCEVPFIANEKAVSKDTSLKLWRHNEAKNVSKTPSKKEITPQKAEHGNLTAIAPNMFDGADDIFDIYSFDHLKDENFGTIIEATSTEDDDNNLLKTKLQQDTIENNENFNYVEACQNLKDEILRNEDDDDESSDKDLKINAVEREECIAPVIKKDDSQYSDNPSRSDSPDSRTNDFNDDHDDMESDNFQSTINLNQKRILLVSGSIEPIIWIWSLDAKVAHDYIKLIVPNKPVLPIIFTNCVWFNDKQILFNTPNGNLAIYNITINSERIVNSVDSKKMTEKGVLSLCLTNNNQRLWLVKMQHSIECLDIETMNTISKLSTLRIWNYHVKPSPFDNNKMVLSTSYKEICVFNITSDITNNYVSFTYYSNKVQGRVLSSAWHPTKENSIALGTSLGRVGIIDITKANNMFSTFIPFTSKGIYSLSWATVTINNEKIICLFACGDSKIVYYPESGVNKLKPVELKQFGKVACVSESWKNYIAFGTKLSKIIICDLNENFKVLYEQTMSTLYVSNILIEKFNYELLAIGTFDGKLTILNCKNIQDGCVEMVTTLEKHEKGITSLCWSTETKNKLMSTSIDQSICVWDVGTRKLISQRMFESQIYGATFSPLNDNLIMALGYDITMEVYDINNYKETSNLDSRIMYAGEIDVNMILSAEHNVVNKIVKKKLKVNKVITTDDLTKALGNIALSRDGETLQNDIQNLTHVKNLSKDMETSDTQNDCQFKTVLHLSAKEMNNEPLKKLSIILKNSDNTSLLNKKLFESSDSARELCSLEVGNIRRSGLHTKSVSTHLMSQLTDNLKLKICENITNKCLTVNDISLAPTISHDFWRKCCEAYALQMIDSNNLLVAVTYLLAIHNVNDAINYLHDFQYYREAYLIAKLRKEEDDPIFDKILLNWVNKLINDGNFDAAAYIATCAGNYDQALDCLGKHKIVDEELQEIFKVLKERL